MVGFLVNYLLRNYYGYYYCKVCYWLVYARGGGEKFFGFGEIFFFGNSSSLSEGDSYLSWTFFLSIFYSSSLIIFWYRFLNFFISFCAFYLMTISSSSSFFFICSTFNLCKIYFLNSSSINFISLSSF